MAKRITKEDVKYVYENLGRKSYVEIAKDLGCCKATVYNIKRSLEKAGIVLPELKKSFSKAIEDFLKEIR